jgi:hypothetical protein
MIERISMSEVKNDADGKFLDCWRRRPLSQISTYKVEAILAMIEDKIDGYKWKLKFGASPNVVEKWPFVLELTDAAKAIFPNVSGSAFVITAGSTPSGETGTWYVLNRFSGGAPTWSPEAVDPNIKLYPCVTPKSNRNASDVRRSSFSGTVYHGTGTFRNIHDMSTSSSSHGAYQPALRGDGDWWIPISVTENMTNLNGNKAYAIVTVGYPFQSLLETMEVDPADQSLDAQNVKTSKAIFRVNDAWDFYYRRASQDQASSKIQAINHKDRIDLQRWLLQSASISAAMLSKWDTRSSLILSSDGPFPLSIQVIAIEVQVGEE